MGSYDVHSSGFAQPPPFYFSVWGEQTQGPGDHCAVHVQCSTAWRRGSCRADTVLTHKDSTRIRAATEALSVTQQSHHPLFTSLKKCIFTCIHILPVWVSVPCKCLVPTETKRRQRVPETGAIDGCRLSCRRRKSSCSLTAEPSPHTRGHILGGPRPPQWEKGVLCMKEIYTRLHRKITSQGCDLW